MVVNPWMVVGRRGRLNCGLVEEAIVDGDGWLLQIDMQCALALVVISRIALRIDCAPTACFSFIVLQLHL